MTENKEEPSMEDILSSIRKILSDDDVDKNNEGNLLSGVANNESSASSSVSSLKAGSKKNNMSKNKKREVNELELTNSMAVKLPKVDNSELYRLIKELLKPALNSWLDKNLPNMIEGIIRERISKEASKKKKK